MKPLFPAFFALIGLSLSGHSQEASSQEPVPAQETTACILGTIPDGTPPPPDAPKPEFNVSPKDILETTTVEQGGRTITLREIKPIDLPPPPPEPTPFVPDSPFQARLTDYQSAHPKSDLLFLSATVYRSKISPPRTLVRWWPQAGGESINFWSSADFSLIAGGIQSFADGAGNTHFMSIGWGNVEIASTTNPQAAKAQSPAVPTIPDFPEGKATVAFIGKAPADEDHLVIQSLHDLYNKNHGELLTAYQGREQARLAREAELKANPPQPQDITLNYWRIGGAETAPTNGGTK